MKFCVIWVIVTQNFCLGMKVEETNPKQNTPFLLVFMNPIINRHILLGVGGYLR
jgi:hypothetical protein